MEKVKEKTSIKSIRGITLIALIITIIVLLILAGVSIATLTGENGLLNKAEDAVLQTEISNIAEQIELLSINLTVDMKLGSGEEDILEYLSSQGIINDQNVIDTQKLSTINSKYGKGTTTDIFKIENGKIVYINQKGEKTAERIINIETKDFVTEWKVEANDIIVLPIGIGYTEDNNFIVDW